MAEKILIIEDEEKLARFIELELRHEGYLVDKVADGRAGLEAAERGDYDVLLLDVMLPGMSGMELLRRLRRTKQVPVIMVTARDAVIEEIAVALARGHRIPMGPWCVRLTRLTPFALVDVGNLWSALKAVEDAVAAAVGCDDGSPAWGVCVAQQKRRGPLAVRIEIWGSEARP